MSDRKKCKRCGEPAETRDNIAETSFWGALVTSTETIERKSVRIFGTHVKGSSRETRVLRSDEETRLCSPCWGLLVGHFLQGRPVAPAEHEHQWRLAGRIRGGGGDYPREVCDLCLQDRIAHGSTDRGSADA